MKSIDKIVDDYLREAYEIGSDEEDLDRSTLQTLIEDNYHDSINYLSELESQTR